MAVISNDNIAKLVALLKELVLEKSPYIKQATERTAKVTSGTKRIFIKLLSICKLIVSYDCFYRQSHRLNKNVWENPN